MTFAELLRAYKAELGVNADELSVILGVPVRTVEAWIAGRYMPIALAQEGAIARLQAVIDRRGMVEVIMPKTKWAKPRE